MRLGDTPVPIPNTMVKTQAADGTALETVWESRWLPAPLKKVWGTPSEHKTGTHKNQSDTYLENRIQIISISKRLET